jgi:hypothetical protein
MIYTAIVGGYDTVKLQPCPVQVLREGTIPYYNIDPCRTAKFAKVMSHIVDGNWLSVWIDGSITLNPNVLCYEALADYLGDCDIAVMLHPERSCVYEEAAECIRTCRDDSKVITDQVIRYSHEGYPSNASLSETGVIIRRHSKDVIRFNSYWWDEITRGSRRDQLSFPYVAWKLGIPYTQIPGRPFFSVGSHVQD